MDLGQFTALEAAYRSVLLGKKKWLLLQYPDSIDLRRLVFCSQGSKGLDELEASFHEYKVQHAVYREDKSPSTGFVIITYIPTNISGIDRARALVNARHLLTTLQGCTALLTVDKLSELTQASVHQALMGQHRSRQIQRSLSEPMEPTLSHLHDNAQFVSQRSMNLNVQILGRNRSHGFSKIDMESPPVPPPKDNHTSSQISKQQKALAEYLSRAHSNPGVLKTEPIMVAPYPPEPNNWPILKKQHAEEPRSLHVPLRGKWAVTMMSDPAERARFRSEAEAKRQQEEEEAVKREQEYQAKIRQEKKAIIQRNLEDQAQRMATLEQDLARAVEERRRREHMEKVEEERSRRLSELRRRIEKEKRLEMHRQMEMWRKEQLCREEQARHDLEEAKIKQTKDMLQRISRAQAQLRNGQSGWVGIQTSKTLTWKRRVFKLSGGKIYIYRDEKEQSPLIAEVDIKSEVSSIREWDEGHEELKTIPFSFVVEFTRRDEIWMMYTDTEDEKYMIFAYVYQIAKWIDFGNL